VDMHYRTRNYNDQVRLTCSRLDVTGEYNYMSTQGASPCNILRHHVNNRELYYFVHPRMRTKSSEWEIVCERVILGIGY
jgi:hypothetical protein